MIGKVYKSVVLYYDSKSQQTRTKTRPVLIVGGPRNNDYTVLPISTITLRKNLDPEFDILIDASSRSILNLPKECFIRTHKQMTVHRAELVSLYGDMKADIPDLYLDALVKMEGFQKRILAQSLS